jgi:hypothetical protein
MPPGVRFEDLSLVRKENVATARVAFTHRLVRLAITPEL